MKDDNLRRPIITAFILCCVLLTVAIFFHNVDIFFKGINYILSSLIVMIVVIVMIVLFIKNIIVIIKNRKRLTLKIYLPATIYLITVLLCFILPDPESFESKVIISANYKGTQNQANIKFREDKTFELNWSAVFRYNEWFTGNYTKKGDTLYLKYNH